MRRVEGSRTWTTYRTRPNPPRPPGVRTTTTDVHFGGFREWFICPKCERRTAMLHEAYIDGPIGCRVCLQLKHTTAATSDPLIRTMRRYLKIEAQLGPQLTRPRYMDGRRYKRLLRKATAANAAAMPLIEAMYQPPAKEE